MTDHDNELLQRRASRRLILRRAAQFGAGAALAGAAIDLLAACGPTGSTSAGNKQLVIAQGLDPETLDAQGSTTQATLNVSTQVNENLVEIDYSQGSKGLQIMPLLLTSWKQVDNTTMQVELRNNVKFTNGEAWDANALKFNIERLQNPATKSPAKSYVDVIDHVEVVSATTAKIVTKAPSPNLLMRLSKVYIVPPKYTQSDNGASLAKKPIGTGPFTFVEWVKDDHITLKANPDYWGGKPKLDQVLFKPIPEDATRVASLKSGQSDIITNLPISEIQSVSSAQNLAFSKVPSLRLMFVILDATNNSAVKDKRVRQALNYAVDKNALIQNTFQGNAIILQGQALSQEYFGFNPNLKAVPYDPAKAKQLLADAGYANGLTVTLWSPQGRYVLDKETSEAISGQLAKVGVTANVQTRDWATYVKMLIDKTLTPTAFIGYSTFPDADDQLGINETGNTYSYYANSAFDQIMKQARTTIDATQRQQLYAQATQLMADDSPYIYLWQQVDTYGANKRVNGWTPRPDERIMLAQTSVS